MDDDTRFKTTDPTGGPRVAPYARAKQARSNPSLFGPIVLISVGIVLLLDNFNLLPDVNWDIALRLWPLLLIFWGLNLIVRQVPRPFGSFLSALVGLTAVGVFAWVLLFSGSVPFLGDLSTEPTVARTEQIQAPLAGVETANVNIDFSSVRAEVAGDAADGLLVDGQISSLGDLVFDVVEDNGEADVRIDTRTASGWFLNPSSWRQAADLEPWRISLSDRVIYDMTLDLASGATTLDLRDLRLSEFNVDGGSGRFDLSLPGGNYDGVVDGGSGASRIVLPDSGRHTFTIDGGSGSMTLVLPADMQLRVEVDAGSGAFSAENRLDRIDERGDVAIWQTAGYDDAANRTLLKIDGSSGAIRIERP
jgi:hypothetical protein